MFKFRLLVVVLSAAVASISVEAKPACHCPVSHDLRPLCASDGRSYSNDDALECAKKCHRISHDVVKVHDWYCAANGQMHFTTRSPKNLGPQPIPESRNCECFHYHIYDPLCASNGKSYANDGELECDKKCHGTSHDVVKVHNGNCRENEKKGSALGKTQSTDCFCPVTADYAPFCASDGESYVNAGSLECAKKCHGTSHDVVKVHDGNCKAFQPEIYPSYEKCQCDHVYVNDPVCASDGKSYDNEGELQCHKKCYDTNDLFIVHRGRCHINLDPVYPVESIYPVEPYPVQPYPIEPDKCQCSHVYVSDPVCGSNGETYENSLELECDKKCHNKNDLVVAYHGRCNMSRPPIYLHK
ncbi:hypothetical protein TKK_0007449 [Trichogramma kaykai]|uniref:Kazal-like domain-containing protein n=1 Tax=Trichogramma kaykai TaxID=54128 RepID=A0ABD2WHR1_9HYME